jgi:hypothetical protein
VPGGLYSKRTQRTPWGAGHGQDGTREALTCDAERVGCAESADAAEKADSLAWLHDEQARLQKAVEDARL